MLYLSSQATSDGALAITVTFELGTDRTKRKSSCKTGWPLPAAFTRGGFGALASP